MIYNAKIIDNKPHCNCGEVVEKLIDYKTVLTNGEIYTMFIGRCYKCKEDNRYLADVRINGTKRYEISSEIKIIE